MLKIGRSFCKCMWLTHDTLYPTRIHAKLFTSFTGSNTCTAGRLLGVTPVEPIIQQYYQRRHYANTKNKSVRAAIKSNDSKHFKHKQMSRHWEPTCSHVSNAGDFEIVDMGEGCGNVRSKHSNICGTQDSPIHLDFRKWEVAGKKSDTEGNFRFKVLSYNVLAQYLLECYPYLYTNCDPHNLKWKSRARILFDEIMLLDPDILCFQEVQVSHLSTFFNRFEQLGYFGVFKQKTGQRQDGCAIYFRQSMFVMEDQMSVEFYQPKLPILNRDNIGIMVKLVPRCWSGSPLVVATTHLLYNPKRTDVRLAQLQVFLAEIDRFSYLGNGVEGHLPIILTGDLNSTPDSAVIKLLDRGRVSASPFRDSSDWKKIGVTDNCQHLSVYLNRQKKETETTKNIIKTYNSDYCSNVPNYKCSEDNTKLSEHNELFNSGVIGHSLKLMSVYNKVKQNGHTEATTFQDYWVTVDYIYFSCHAALNLVERLRLPTARECHVLGSLPNNIYGSDHLVLGAIFEMKPMGLKCSL